MIFLTGPKEKKTCSHDLLDKTEQGQGHAVLTWARIDVEKKKKKSFFNFEDTCTRLCTSWFSCGSSNFPSAHWWCSVLFQSINSELGQHCLTVFAQVSGMWYRKWSGYLQKRSITLPYNKKQWASLGALLHVHVQQGRTKVVYLLQRIWWEADNWAHDCAFKTWPETDCHWHRKLNWPQTWCFTS